MSQMEKSRASGSGLEQGGIALNASGEVISEFRWEDNSPLKASIGPDAIRINSNARTSFGGRASTKGLAPGQGEKDIELEIEGSALFDLEGIDISIDYRRNESSGNFFSRGMAFNFGMDNGFITIQYRTDNGKGGYNTVKEKTRYEIPVDPIFRTYRFIYNPVSGKGEIFVNSVVVWSHHGTPNTPMHWQKSGNIMIGKGMNGGGADKVVFDNLIIRTTGTSSVFAESLLNFMLEPKEKEVSIYWSTTMNNKVDYFSIERSINGVDFVNISNIKANPNLPPHADYMHVDRTNPTSQIVYYRLRQTFLNGKFVLHPLSAVKFKSERKLAIDHVSPSPFSSSFDISYVIPAAGRVWIQLVDEKGKIVNTETIEAGEGKNIYNYRDKKNITSGEYTLYVIFDNKKVSSKVIKS
ncbi:MAG: hypothetical protein DWQ39_01870 [Bacteroidetes bacterium]|nr:MAG: hypothetical protein DWQ39_01870 [Bacteroidota bacterium]